MAPSKETLFNFAPWVLFITWFLLAASFLIVLARFGVQPIDYQSYQRATERIAQGKSPYLTPEASRQIWRKMHRAEALVMSGQPQGAPQLLQPGPYLYPPTLALLIHRLHIDAAFFVLILWSAVCSFGLIWVRSARTSGWWLLLIVGSWDVLMHPCADQNKNLPYYIQLREKLGWSGKYFWLFGPETALDVQIKSFGQHDVICGNVDPPSLQFKSYEEVFQLCKENIQAGKDSPNGYVLSPGCELPPLAAPIKIMAMMDAAEQFGRYE